MAQSASKQSSLSTQQKNYFKNSVIFSFDYDKMLTCSKSVLKVCADAVEILQLQFDALREVSLCGKQRTVSKIMQDLSSGSNEVSNSNS